MLQKTDDKRHRRSAPSMDIQHLSQSQCNISGPGGLIRGGPAFKMPRRTPITLPLRRGTWEEPVDREETGHTLGTASKFVQPRYGPPARFGRLGETGRAAEHV